jgi:hypothetical protein
MKKLHANFKTFASFLSALALSLSSCEPAYAAQPISSSGPSASVSNATGVLPGNNGGATTQSGTPIYANPAQETVPASTIRSGINILFDTMPYTSRAGIPSTPNSGVAYTVTGAGAAAISAGNTGWTSNNVTYLGQLASSTVARYGMKFKWNSVQTSDAFALVSSADSSITLANMLHLIVTYQGINFTWWQGASQNNPLSCQGPGFPSNLLQDGTVYSMYVDVDLTAHTAIVTDPFGQHIACSDSHINNTIGGNLTIYELGDSTQFITQMEQWSPLLEKTNGTIYATGGFEGAIGLNNPTTGQFNYLNIAPPNPTAYVPFTETVTEGSAQPLANLIKTNSHAQINIRSAGSGGAAGICLTANGQSLPVATSNCSALETAGLYIDGGGTTHLSGNNGGDIVSQAFNGTPVFGNAISTPKYNTASNCASGASPAVCASASVGNVAIPTGVNPTLQVNTTAVTANSNISLSVDDSVTISGVTCNSTLATITGGLAVTARSAGSNFTVSYNGTITTNPLCITYKINN